MEKGNEEELGRISEQRKNNSRDKRTGIKRLRSV